MHSVSDFQLASRKFLLSSYVKKLLDRISLEIASEDTVPPHVTSLFQTVRNKTGIKYKFKKPILK